MKNIVDGGDLMLFIPIKEKTNSGGSSLEATVNYTLAFATSHKLSISVETVENTSKDNGGGKWVSKIAKKMSWNISSENLFIENGKAGSKDNTNQKAFGDLFEMMVSREPIDVIFSTVEQADEIPTTGWTPKENAATYTGKVIITSLEANAQNGENATYSVQLEGVGALSHTRELSTPEVASEN